MDKDHLISLTKSVYQLTLLFPKKEPLRYKMRELADEILADFIIDPKNETFKKLEILDSFFEIVKVQNWAPKDLILLLQKEYSKLKENLNKDQSSKLNERQAKILEILKEKEKVQVREIKEIFPQVSKRTLRRDFEKLVSQGLVERIGEKINTFYQLRNRTNKNISQVS